MNTMQPFYHRLFQPVAPQVARWHWLAALARASLAQVTALRSEMVWNSWTE